VGGGYPRGLVIGRVAYVDHRDSALSDTALVAWSSDPSALNMVLVITDFTPE
jgi:cell shape-determining protein MreC